MKKEKLDKYEQELVDSYESGEWKSIKNVKPEIKKHQTYARNTIAKNKRINIRISSKDLEDVQVLALEEGLPYQTLIASIIHKFINGNFIEKKQITRHSS
ncbi:MAG: hypothetical protein KAJ14_09790 [Candidatus Omnitrophica bacterium]|nr:hypothetical protein [Candidatus Omnitrophota bacterium]